MVEDATGLAARELDASSSLESNIELNRRGTVFCGRLPAGSTSAHMHEVHSAPVPSIACAARMFEAFRCVKPLSDKKSAEQGRGGKRSSAAAAGEAPAPSKRPAALSRGEAGPTAGASKDTFRGADPRASTDEVSPGQGLPEKLGDAPLRLVIVGHNPSDHAWSSGHYYSNPANWMWRILKETGIAPAAVRGAEDDGLMPQLAGVGFTDVGTGNPGTQSAQFKSSHFDAWRGPFFRRLAEHAQHASALAGCTCGRCGAPVVVAFSGKRQFSELFQGAAPKSQAGAPAGEARGIAQQLLQKQSSQAQRQGQEHGSQQLVQKHGSLEAAGSAQDGQPMPAAAAAAAGPAAAAVPPQAEGDSAVPSSTPPPDLNGKVVCYQRRRPPDIPTGRQWVLPEGWPLPPSTEVWVMTSTSGAAALTREQRLRPWRELAQRLLQEPWPRKGAHCGGGGEEGSHSLTATLQDVA